MQARSPDCAPSMDTCVGGRVRAGGCRSDCLKCPHGTNVDDRAAAARLHALCCRLRCEELALEDGIQEPVVLFLGHIGEGDRLKDSRAIDENVYAANFLSAAWTNARLVAGLAISPLKTATRSDCPNPAAAARSFASSRPFKTTRAPSACRRLAVSRPIPEPPPVTMLVLSLNRNVYSS